MKNRLFALLGLGVPLGTAAVYAQTINLFPSAKQVAKAFYVQSYQVGQPFPSGKCLDYPAAALLAAVLLNDCAKAHTILDATNDHPARTAGSTPSIRCGLRRPGLFSGR